MEEIKSSKTVLEPETLEKVSGGVSLERPRDITNDSHYMRPDWQQSSNETLRLPLNLFNKIVGLFQPKHSKGPNGSGNGGR